MIRAASVVLAVLAMMIPLGWVCVRMAAHVPGGTALVAGIAGAVALGGLTAVGGLLRRR